MSTRFRLQQISALAEVLLRGLEAGFLDFRKVVHELEKRPLSF